VEFLWRRDFYLVEESLWSCAQSMLCMTAAYIVFNRIAMCLICTVYFIGYFVNAYDS